MGIQKNCYVKQTMRNGRWWIKWIALSIISAAGWRCHLACPVVLEWRVCHVHGAPIAQRPQTYPRCPGHCPPQPGLPSVTNPRLRLPHHTRCQLRRIGPSNCDVVAIQLPEAVTLFKMATKAFILRDSLKG